MVVDGVPLVHGNIERHRSKFGRVDSLLALKFSLLVGQELANIISIDLRCEIAPTNLDAGEIKSNLSRLINERLTSRNACAFLPRLEDDRRGEVS